jgi:hypothetical protein
MGYMPWYGYTGYGYPTPTQPQTGKTN